MKIVKFMNFPWHHFSKIGLFNEVETFSMNLYHFFIKQIIFSSFTINFSYFGLQKWSFSLACLEIVNFTETITVISLPVTHSIPKKIPENINAVQSALFSSVHKLFRKQV